MQSSQAIILDANQRSALATTRSLGRRGVQVIVADSSTPSLASSSRYCTQALVYPDPAHLPDQFISWLHEVSARFPHAVLLPMTDVTVPLVLRAESQGQIGKMRLALPTLDAYTTASDKLQLFHLAENCGVRAPHTVLISRGNLQSIDVHGLRYPLVVKPRASAVRDATGIIKRGVMYASDPSELLRLLEEELRDHDDELLLQEYIVGYGAGLFALYDHGEPILFFAHKRIREKPPSGGVSVLCESASIKPEVMNAARKLLEPLHWHGVAMVEFKIDRCGEPWLIEVNARFWGSLQLAVDCNADFPAALYAIAMGQKVDRPAINSHLQNRRLRWWLGDLDNLYARLRDRKWTPRLVDKVHAVLEFALPWQPGLKYEFFRLHDPKPALTALLQYLRALRTPSRGA